MTIKEFIDLCLDDYLPVTVRNEDLDLVTCVDRLIDLKDKDVANREIDALGAYPSKDNNSPRWFIVVKN